jgi:hypothetical protein
MHRILIASVLGFGLAASPVAVAAASSVAAAASTPAAVATPAAPQPGELRINEFLPNPVGTDSGNEWIELANVSDHDLDAGGVTVTRTSGTTLATLAAGTTIGAGEVYLIDHASGSIVNGGDTLTLTSGSTELDRVTYDDGGQEGWSWARMSSTEGVWTSDPTPGEPNPAEAPADPGDGSDSSGDSSDGSSASTSAATSSSSAKAKKSSASKLPKSGPDAAAYAFPAALAMLYWYVRRRRIARRTVRRNS